jgi:hypothetical protein
MFDRRPEALRQYLILDCLKKFEKRTLPQLMKYVNAQLPHYTSNKAALAGYGKSTFEKTLHAMRIDNDCVIVHSIENGDHVYRLQNADFIPFLSESQKHEMGFLLSLMAIYDKLDSVQLLKDLLREEYQLDDSYYKSKAHFVMMHPIIENHESLLALSDQIIGHIERQEAIKFTYKRVNDESNPVWKYVAPLQIRYFEGRYYLIACEMNANQDFRTDFGTYPLDQIVDGYVDTVPDENIEEGDIIVHFNYQDLAELTDLHNRYKDSLGIITDRNPPQTIRIRFTAWAKSYVMNRKFHDSQRIIQQDEDEVIIEIRVRRTVELDFQLARFRDNYEILSP